MALDQPMLIIGPVLILFLAWGVWRVVHRTGLERPLPLRTHGATRLFWAGVCLFVPLLVLARYLMSEPERF